MHSHTLLVATLAAIISTTSAAPAPAPAPAVFTRQSASAICPESPFTFLTCCVRTITGDDTRCAPLDPAPLDTASFKERCKAVSTPDEDGFSSTKSARCCNKATGVAVCTSPANVEAPVEEEPPVEEPPVEEEPVEEEPPVTLPPVTLPPTPELPNGLAGLGAVVNNVVGQVGNLVGAVGTTVTNLGAGLGQILA